MPFHGNVLGSYSIVGQCLGGSLSLVFCLAEIGFRRPGCTAGLGSVDDTNSCVRPSQSQIGFQLGPAVTGRIVHLEGRYKSDDGAYYILFGSGSTSMEVKF